MRNLFSGILTFIASLILTLTPQQSYTEGLVGQPRSFLPGEVVTENDKTVSKLLFRGLFRYGKEGVLEKDLAESYLVSEDGLSYTIVLKKGEKWSNGQEITANDLLYTAFSTNELKEIATDKIDDYTIRYTLPNKFSPFLTLLTGGVMPANPRNNPLIPLSSGPYRVVRIKREGPVVREVVMQRIENEYRVGRLSFRYYENEDQLLTAAKLGEIEGFVSRQDLDWPNLNKSVFYQRGIYYSLMFNLRSEKLSNVEVRKKLRTATPVDEISAGLGITARGPLSESYFTDSALNFNFYDKGYTDNLNLNLKLTYPDTPEHEHTAEIIKTAWGRVGVIVELKPVKPEDIEDDVVVNRNFEVLLYGQEVSRDPDRYTLWHSTRVSSPGLNITGLENIRLDRSLEEGRNTLVQEERQRHYNIFQVSINDNAPAVFLYHPIAKYYTSRNVKMTQEPFIYYLHDRFLDFSNWEII